RRHTRSKRDWSSDVCSSDLLLSKKDEQIIRLKSILNTMDTIEVTKLRKPKLRDKLAVRHGKYIHRDGEDRKIIRFVRDELGLLEIGRASCRKWKGVWGVVIA